MNASRRGILGMFAASPIIGPELGNSLAKGVSEKEYANAGLLPTAASAVKESTPFANSYYDKRLKRLFSPDAIDRIEIDPWTHYTLDVDLHTNRSMSLPAKYAIQRERMRQRTLAHERKYTLRDVLHSQYSDVPEWIKQAISKFGLSKDD